MTQDIAALPRTTAQRGHYSASPSANFSAEFRVNFAQAQAAAQTGTQAEAEAALGQTLGLTQMESAGRRALDMASEFQFAALLDKAYAANAMDDPQAYLKTLSAGELEQLRVQHGLADTLKVDGLSREGASNLLLPTGVSLDLNADGIDEVGLARMGHFPPRNAPDAFKAAWFAATENTDEGELATQSLMMSSGVYGIQLGDAATPSEPADDMATYRRIVDNILASMERGRGTMAPGQYERDQAFFGRLSQLMGA